MHFETFLTVFTIQEEKKLSNGRQLCTLLSACVRVCVYVSVCVRERQRKRVCVRERERMRVKEK